MINYNDNKYIFRIYYFWLNFIIINYKGYFYIITIVIYNINKIT